MVKLFFEVILKLHISESLIIKHYCINVNFYTNFQRPNFSYYQKA